MSTESQQQQPQKQPSSATDRGLRHIHWGTWLGYLGVAAATRTVLLHPLTVAMARKRVIATENASVFSVLSLSGSTSPHSFSERVRFLYRGFGVALFANVFGETVYFSALEYVRHVLEDNTQLFGVRDAFGGASAELTSLVLTTPLSVVCHRQMTAGFGIAKNVPYGSAMFTLKDVSGHGTESRRLFAGFGVAVAALPAAAIWWGLYSEFKRYSYNYVRHHQPTVVATTSTVENSSSSSSMTIDSTLDNPAINGACGLSASVLTTMLFNPFNVVRTRLQSAGGGSAFLVARAIVKNEGASALLKGAVVSSCSAALEGTITSLVYEYSKWLADHTL